MSTSAPERVVEPLAWTGTAQPLPPEAWRGRDSLAAKRPRAPEAGPSPRVRAAKPAARDPYFDNVKLLALVLVVCGHFWEPLVPMAGQRAVKAVYLLVYAFHMPAFVAVSGWFSRSFASQPRQLRRLATGVLIPFLVWSSLLAVFDEALAGRPLSLRPLTPTWITWFLISLFLWRLSAPIWHTVRAPVTVATLVFLASGAFPLGSQLGITRTLQFLPFFVIGLTARPEHLAWLRGTAWVRAAAVPAFGLAAAAAYLIAPRLQPAWLYRSAAAHDLHVPYTHWLAESTALYAVGIVLAAAFLALVPRRRTWFSALGAGTMYAFLLHAFVREALLRGHLFDQPLLHRPAGWMALTAAATVLALALCTAPVARVLRPFVEPRMAWLFFEPPAPARQRA